MALTLCLLSHSSLVLFTYPCKGNGFLSVAIVLFICLTDESVECTFHIFYINYIYM